MEHVRREIGVSERRACQTLEISRTCCRYAPRVSLEETRMDQEVMELAAQYGRYGYRQVTALMRNRGFVINHKRVERIWRQEGLQVPRKQPRRGRLWLGDGSCIRLRPTHRNHVWSYDFVQDTTHDGRPLRMLTVLDEYTRECLAIKVERNLNAQEVLEVLAGLFLTRGVPEHIRSDNGPEFTAHAVRNWLSQIGVRTLFIEPGSPWENGYNESFNGKLRNELLNGEIFYTLKEAQVLIERWRIHYNTIRPHSALGYKPPAPETVVPANHGITTRLPDEQPLYSHHGWH